MIRVFIEAVVTQHCEEAAFLWISRDKAISRRQAFLTDLARVDNRVEAHLDGLRVAGDAGWETCREVSEQDEPGGVFAAAVLAFESADEGRIGEVLEVGTKTPKLLRGLVSALGWISRPQAEVQVRKLVVSKSAVLRRVGVAAAAVHRQDPGRSLEHALSDADLPLRARALRAVGGAWPA